MGAASTVVGSTNGSSNRNSKTPLDSSQPFTPASSQQQPQPQQQQQHPFPPTQPHQFQPPHLPSQNQTTSSSTAATAIAKEQQASNNTQRGEEDDDPIGLGLHGPLKADTDLSWGIPAGLHMRRGNDENLAIFRRAVGINSHRGWGGRDRGSPGGLAGAEAEEGRSGKGGGGRRGGRTVAMATGGIYAAAVREVQRKRIAYHLLSVLINASHFAQIIIGASLTALGPSAGDHVIVITLLGAINTVIAGVLALVKGQGLPERLNHDRAEFRRLQDWIEQTEALLAVGVLGRDRKEVGVLVQTAFRKYNAAKQCEESNQPENYVRYPETDLTMGPGGPGGGPAAVGGRPVSQVESVSPPPGHAGARSPSPYH
ncbi:uncharacterized protein C8A04DRAFT_10084 [Dichotomopilus funicola]|uniref:SMODS and SLOG-associating 2TM effector domain-containing protein n=1 Tax=Dichotomopilus funicola TaxID=1934379 RepID=A0AAN6ZPH5_9PEZI|nr:hypothetical protein C8A04DRAFT_10084 [Dichotomopilus funicola]